MRECDGTERVVIKKCKWGKMWEHDGRKASSWEGKVHATALNYEGMPCSPNRLYNRNSAVWGELQSMKQPGSMAKQWTSVVATHSRKPLSGAGAPACNPPTRCRHQNHCTQQMLQAKQTLGLLRERTTTENDERAGNGRRHQQRHLLCYGFGKGEGASNWRRLRLAHERSPAITTCKLCKHREQHAPCTLTRALAKLLMYRAIPRAKRYTDQYL